MSKRIAVVDNNKLKDMDKKKHIASLCPINRGGSECMYFDGSSLLIDENLCIGCGICSNVAPESIKIINLPSHLQQAPIHRYSKNGFALYNLPIPVFGKVVGILGRNGIGKSTAMKILGGLFIPNFGNFEREGTWDDLIARFKGSEAQLYFEKVKAGEIVVSYKPQQVDLIPQTTSGTVRSVLEKVDGRGKFDEIVEALDLSRVLERDISKLSGGELQRLAIAATVLKEANLYVFDEPTSFLDIKQRIRVGKFLRSLANEDTAVLVVEHDLIILDYMTDLIHVMYGREAAYGVVSHPMSTKNGINEYLEGYLTGENMRFRDKKISFERRQAFSKGLREALTSWGELKKSLGNFTISTAPGEVKKKDVVGVLGENGIGKTSFIKMLAEEITPDSGEVDEKVTVSYKPQYIDTTSEELVVSALDHAIKHYEGLLVKPLNLEPLFYRKLSELSGGELQRVSIAICLAKEADLYLMDEPSAYLDVEQRLLISKVLRDFMELKGKTAVVIDHDLLFIDYLSDRILVFEGIPAQEGIAHGPFEMITGMNRFLKDIGLTFRRDKESNRPRANKVGSQMDEKQRKDNMWYYL